MFFGMREDEEGTACCLGASLSPYSILVLKLNFFVVVVCFIIGPKFIAAAATYECNQLL